MASLSVLYLFTFSYFTLLCTLNKTYKDFCVLLDKQEDMLKMKDPATIKSLASTEWLCTKDMVSWTTTSLFCNSTDKSSLVTRLNRFVCLSIGAELVPDRSVTSQVSVDVGPFMERRFSVVLKHDTDVCTVRGGQSHLARQVFACGNKGFPVPCQSFFLLTRRSCTICWFVCFITAKTQAFILFLYFFFMFRVFNVSSQKQGWMFLLAAMNNIRYDCDFIKFIFKFRVFNVNSEKQGWMFLFVAINNIHHDCNRVVSSVQLWRNRDIKDGVCSDVTA